jgi:hypothetical protein
MGNNFAPPAQAGRRRLLRECRCAGQQETAIDLTGQRAKWRGGGIGDPVGGGGLVLAATG